MLALDLAAVIVTATCLTFYPVRPLDLVGLGWIALCAGVGIELSQRVERLRERHRDTPYNSLNGVWTLAAALLFPPGVAVLVPVVIYVWSWFRVKKHPPYKWAFSASVSMLSNSAAGLLFSAMLSDTGTGRLPSGPEMLPALLVAIAVYMVTNVTLVGIAILLSAPETLRREAFGGPAEHGVELTEACLGVLVAAVYSITPAAVPLALPVLLLLQRALLLAQFQSAARKDAKTGLANAAWWHEIAGREVDRARRLGEDVSVLIADLDHFKIVNDTHGHLAGDAVLRSVAREFAAEVREYDVVGRFGGEEFVVVLPAADVEQAWMVAERLRRRISQLTIVTPGVGGALARIRALTVSIGVASFPVHGTELNDVLRMADAALYAAKHSGRNRVCVAPDGHSPAVALSQS